MVFKGFPGRKVARKIILDPLRGTSPLGSGVKEFPSNDLKELYSESQGQSEWLSCPKRGHVGQQPAPCGGFREKGGPELWLSGQWAESAGVAWAGRQEENYSKRRAWDEGSSLPLHSRPDVLSTCTLCLVEHGSRILGSHPRKDWASLCALRPYSTRPPFRGRKAQAVQGTHRPSPAPREDSGGARCGLPKYPFQLPTEWEDSRPPSLKGYCQILDFFHG